MNKPTSEDLPGLIYAQSLLREAPALGGSGAFGGRLKLAIDQAEAAYGREHRSSAPIDYPEAQDPAPGKQDGICHGIALPRWRLRLIKIARSDFVAGLLKAHGHLPLPFRLGILVLQVMMLGVVLYSVVGQILKQWL